MRTPNTRSLVIDEENMGGLDYRDEDELEVNFKTASWDEREELTELQWVVSKEELIEMVVGFMQIGNERKVESFIKVILEFARR